MRLRPELCCKRIFGVFRAQETCLVAVNVVRCQWRSKQRSTKSLDMWGPSRRRKERGKGEGKGKRKNGAGETPPLVTNIKWQFGNFCSFMTKDVQRLRLAVSLRQLTLLKLE